MTQRGATQIYKCKTCRDPFRARVADRARGWARFCSKSCKAVKQTQKTGVRGPYRDERDEDAHPCDLEQGW